MSDESELRLPLVTHHSRMRTEDYADLYALEEDFWWFSGMRAITAALLDPFCPAGTDRDVLDAGCGTGGNLAWLRRYTGGGKVVGIDLVSSALQFCLQRQAEHLVQTSAIDLPFASESFDLVTSFDVLEQLPGEESDERAIDEMSRVLRPGGICFVRVPAYEWMLSGHDAALATVRRYALRDLRGKMERSQLKVLRATYANGLLLPLAAFRRLILKPLRLSDPGSDVKPLPPRLRWMNRALHYVLRQEASLLKRPRAGLPFGLSAICIAQKPRADSLKPHLQ